MSVQEDLRRSWRPKLNPRDRPKYLAIARALAADVRAGALRPGERLPAQRALARRLGVNLTTVMRAIAEAQRQGVVDGQRGRGTFVREVAAVPGQATGAPAVIDLTNNLPPTIVDPPLASLLAAATAEACAGDGATAMLGYPVRGGNPSDRVSGAAWLSRRGLTLDPERILVTAGADHALLIALLAFTRAGDTLLAEELTYPAVRALAAMLGLRLVGVRVDEQGLDPEALRKAFRLRPKLLLCTPTIQNPTGSVLPAERRAAVVRLAREHGVLLLEDDVYGFLPTDAPAPLAALAPDTTVYLTSLKCIAPGLRIGYVAAANETLLGRMAAVARATTWTPPTLVSAIATRWIQDGTAGAALAAVRRELAARQTLAAQVLAGRSVQAHPVAPHLWLKLPRGWSRGAFVERARRHGVAVLAADAFATSDAVPEAVRVCLGSARDGHEAREALGRLQTTLREAHGLGPAVV